MKDEHIDAILSNETDIAPSSGFAGSVMEAVRSKAAAPPPIPFPWKRALPGIAACGIALILLLLEAFRSPVDISTAGTVYAGLSSHVTPWFVAFEMAGGGWILLAILLTLGGIKLTLRLANGR
jgi:hypothetical protein